MAQLSISIWFHEENFAGTVDRALRVCHPVGFLAPFPRVSVDPSSLLPNEITGSRRKTEHTAEALNQATADKELMRQVVAGDEAAFSSFYRRFAPGLFSMVYQILQDQKEAEDVVQESFVQMWRKASGYDAARSGLFTWAVMISRNKAIDRFRSRQRRSRTIEAATAELSVVPPKSIDQADDLLGKTEERDRVRAALAELPDSQREAIDLAFFGGLTQSEISTKLGAPLGTVKARIRRGLLALRDVLRIER